MGFRLTPRSKTLDDLELIRLAVVASQSREIPTKFDLTAVQGLLDEFGMLSRRAVFSATAELSCFLIETRKMTRYYILD